jgi:hypothetical protein
MNKSALPLPAISVTMLIHVDGEGLANALVAQHPLFGAAALPDPLF